MPWHGRMALSIVAFAVLGQPTQAAAAGTEREAVRDFMRSYFGTAGDDDAVRLTVAFSDLNADGSPEALVYVVGPHWCGTGGCSLYVLDRKPRGYRIVARQPTTRLPVSVLDRRTNGWRDLSIIQSDAFSRVEVVLQFDGWKYSSLVEHTARKNLPGAKPGRVLIDDKTSSIALWP